MTTSNTAITQLNENPVTVSEFTSLMDITNPDIGFAAPICYDITADEKTKNCIAGVIEHDGVITGAYFNGEKWIETTTSENDIDGYFNTPNIMERVNENISVEFNNNSPYDINRYNQNDFEYIPPGFFTKLALRHIPLTDQHAKNTHENNAIKELYMTHKKQVSDDEENKFIGIISIENSNFTDTPNHVFMYYEKDIGTWRVHDSTNQKPPNNVVKKIQSEITNRLTESYPNVNSVYNETTTNTANKVDIGIEPNN